ncbi:MAG: hypothetical protein U1F34_03045 [Gammaproteobacteria bacterium]
MSWILLSIVGLLIFFLAPLFAPRIASKTGAIPGAGRKQSVAGITIIFPGCRKQTE